LEGVRDFQKVRITYVRSIVKNAVFVWGADGRHTTEYFYLINTPARFMINIKDPKIEY
jgi:hypothetical protein